MSATILAGRTRLGGTLGVLLFLSFIPLAAWSQEETASLERAKGFYREGEYGRAITELEAALVRSTGHPPEELAAMHLYLGLAYLGFGRTERAHSEFLEALRLDPDLEATPDVRSPQVEEALARARWTVEEETGELSPGEGEPGAPLGQAIEPPRVPTGKTRWGGVWRSSLLPGWGQHYGGRPVRGYAFMAGELASLGATLVATRERDRAYDEYESATSHDAENVDDLYADYDSWRKTRRTFLIVAGGFWALNVLESLLNDPGVPREDRAMGEWRVGRVPIGDGGWRVSLCRVF